MDSNAEIFLVKQKCDEFLAFSSLEVRFLVDKQQLQQQQKPYKCHSGVETVFLRLDSALAHVCEYDGHLASARAVCVVQLGFPWLTAELRGCVHYCQHLTVVTVMLVRTLSSHL